MTAAPLVQQTAAPSAWREGQLLVGFNPEVTEPEREVILRKSGGSPRALRGASGLVLLTYQAGENLEAHAAVLTANLAIKFAEPNYLIRADEVVPNDSRFSEQWALRNTGQAGGQTGADIGATAAWEQTSGAAGTVIAVIDSGIDFSHPDLRANRWVNSAERNNKRDDDGNGFADDFSGWDFVTDAGEGTDEHGHGTSVAGIIAAEGNNGVGIAGVMWSAGLMNLRVLDASGTGDIARAVEAIDYAVAGRAQVINISWGTQHESKALGEALARARYNGALVVCSAGNDGRNIDAAPHYPASYDLPNIIAVSSTNNLDQLTSWSNWGGVRPALGAPGADVLTTERGGGYRRVSGSSFSAPFVSGVAGLVRTLRPRLSAERTRAMLTRGVRQADSLQGKVAAGGVVSAAGALGAMDTLQPKEGRDESTEEKGAGNNGNNDGKGNSPANGNSLVYGNGQGGNDSARGAAPVRGRPASNLPDLNVVRALRPATPRARAPIPSTLRNCPPHNPRCNTTSMASPTPKPTPPVQPRKAEGARLPEQVFLAASSYRMPRAIASVDVSLLDYLRNEREISDTGTGGALDLGLPRLLASTHGLLPSLFPAVAQTGNNAAYPTETAPTPAPTPLHAGETYNVSIRMTNTGSTTWSPENFYRLGGYNPLANPPDDSTWRLSRVQLPSKVAPGETVTIPFTITAPTVAGTYNFQWRMVQDGVEWFGAPSENKQITVNAPNFEGYFDFATCSGITGWAWHAQQPNTPLEVDVFEEVAPGNDIFLARVVADGCRPDLVAAGKGNGCHGFSFAPPAALRDGNSHTVKVRVANTTFLPGGSPVLTGSTKTVAGCAASPGSTSAPAGLVVTSASDTQVDLAWTPVAGASRYRVERGLTKTGLFVHAGGTTAANFPDAGRTRGTAYLYRVCAADAHDNCVSPYGNIALGTAYSFFDPQLYTYADNPSLATPIKAQHITELRAVVSAVRAAAELPTPTWGEAVATGGMIRASHIHELRSKLTEALSALNILPPAYTDPTLLTGASGTLIKRAHVEELRLRSTRASNTFGQQPVSSSGTQAAAARLETRNETGGSGVGLLSGNFNLSLPLLGLRGRAGLDLGLSLAYNSLVWTKSGSTVHFNADYGSPAPGFRLGFPVIQPQYYNAQTGANAYLLITPSGARVELRQVAPYQYESADSSYLKLHDNGAGFLHLWTPDGTRMAFFWKNGDHRLAEVRDRNGNLISVSHDSQGRLLSVTDTLARTIAFNYDANQNLLSITQTRAGQEYTWATFGYGVATIGDVFSNSVTLAGAQEGQALNVLTQVGLSDGSSYRFDYNDYAQVTAVRRFSADNHQLAYTNYDYQANADDCPRVSARRDWALDWNNEQEAVTTYARDAGGAWSEVTAPDGTRYRELYDTGQTAGWKKGLTTGTEVYAGGIKQKWTTLQWTQDDEGLGYEKNARVKESHTYDPGNNHRRTRIDYYTPSELKVQNNLPPEFELPSAFGLAKDIFEYGADAATVLRRTRLEYQLGTAYLSAHLIGLVSARHVYEGGNDAGGGTPVSKMTHGYDETSENRLVPTSTTATPTQHDSTYGTGSTPARGLQTSVKRWSVLTPYTTDNPEFVESKFGYNTTGSVVFTMDAGGHKTLVSYDDSFSYGGNRNTFAYPTAVTDPDQANVLPESQRQRSLTEYHYDMGVVTRTQGVSPDTTRFPVGPVQTFVYDAVGRIERVTNTTSGAYMRRVYAPGQNWVQTFTTVKDINTEAYSIQVMDGAGRVYAGASDFPNSTGAYKGQHTVYDVTGRAVRSSNPTEMTSAWEPAGDDAPTAGGGWRYATQDYDWKGRPTYSTNPDGGMNQELIYGGCGCAGGEVVTTRDAMGRRSRQYADALGRQIKTEDLNWDGTIYRTATNSYNALDQLTRVLAQGTTGAAQETLLTYDGHGRLATQKTPIQTSATVYAYNPDDTTASVKDARGATRVLTYNARHLVTDVSYSVPAGSNIPDPADVTLTYDTVGNRKTMTEVGTGGSVTYEYDALSRLTSEARQFPGLSGTYTLAYQYTVAGALKQVTDQNAGTNFSYTQDTAGQLTGVNGAGYGATTTFAANMRYRAWGALKSLTYGNNLTLATSYTNRLQVSRQEVGGRAPQYGAPLAAAVNYHYYADGSLRFADDQVDERFDRAYTYDQASRLSEAYSGSEAGAFIAGTQSGTQTGPYRQTYTHDVWDNLTSRYNRFWSQDDTLLASYDPSNNRRAGWLYDAAGQVTQDDTLQMVYDAAGRNSEVISLVDGLRIAPVFDGDGQSIKRVESQHGTVTQTTYYLRSSVLGGKVITELNSQGQRLKSYVYAGGEVLAERVGTQEVVWRHDFSLTGSRGESGTAGWYQSTIEPDPMGAHVGFEDPFIFIGGGGSLEPETPSLLGNFDLPDGRCQLDGMPISCGSVSRLIQSGIAAFESFTTVRVTYTSGRVDTFMGWSTLPGGIDVRFTGQLAQDANLAFRLGNIWGGFNTGVNWAIKAGYEARDNAPADGPGGRIYSAFASYFAPPQNTARQSSIFDDAYRDCLSSLGGAVAPGLVQTAVIVQAANTTGVDRTLLAFTWYEESGGFHFYPKNGIHGRTELIGDIGPGQIFPGIWDKSPYTDGLSNPFGTNREVGQVFNGDPVENLILAGRALNHPLGAVQGDRRAEAAGLYKAGRKSGPGYQLRVDKWNKANVKGYDNFFECLGKRGF